MGRLYLLELTCMRVKNGQEILVHFAEPDAPFVIDGRPHQPAIGLWQCIFVEISCSHNGGSGGLLAGSGRRIDGAGGRRLGDRVSTGRKEQGEQQNGKNSGQGFNIPSRAHPGGRPGLYCPFHQKSHSYHSFSKTLISVQPYAISSITAPLISKWFDFTNCPPNAS